MARSVIVSAVRTPFGKLGGGLRDHEAPQLGAVAIRAALERAGLAGDEVEYVIMGQVLQGGAGQAPARQAAVGAGLPKEVPADTINKVCASSIRAVEMADQMIRAGDHDVIVAGGMESMSNAPYVLKQARFGYRLGDGAVIDLMLHDGLVSSFDGKHMVEQASFVSRELGITREEQDEWALRSHQRAVAAADEGRYADEIVAVDGVEADEAPRRDTSLEKLASLKPVFDAEGTTTAGNAPGVNDGAGALVITSEELARERGLEILATIVSQGYVADEFAYLARTPAKAAARALEKLSALRPVFDPEGTTTAGNAPGVNDGAGALVVTSEDFAKRRGLEILATIVSQAYIADEFAYLARTPAKAGARALEKAGKTIDDVERVEINEAFASVTVNSVKMLGADPEKVNVNGGAVALGHPVGASGARILGTMIHELRRNGGGLGLAAICSGGGQGDAVLVEV